MLWSLISLVALKTTVLIMFYFLFRQNSACFCLFLNYILMFEFKQNWFEFLVFSYKTKQYKLPK